MKLVVAAMVLAACGPGLKREDPKAVATSSLSGVHDAAAFAKLVKKTTNAGVWFPDEKCRNQFSTPGEIEGERSQDFARCLASLSLRASARVDALSDVAVLTYAPGFEIEARVVDELDGPQLTWIGPVALRDDDRYPTITPDTLEQLRTAGDPQGALDPVVAKQLVDALPPALTQASAWFKVCIDVAGNVKSVQAREGSSGTAVRAFQATLSSWQFRPFVAAGRPVPVCSMVRLATPAAGAPSPETLPLPPPPSADLSFPIVLSTGALVEGARISGNPMIIPDDETKRAIQQSGARRITASIRICLDTQGKVESVLPYLSSGFPAYDRKLIAHMRQWIYRPYMDGDRAVAVCTGINFIYSQR